MPKKYYIALDDFERRVIVNCLNEMAENGEIGAIIVKDYCAIIGLNQKDLENQGILA